jgi:hypothetical protein
MNEEKEHQEDKKTQPNLSENQQSDHKGQFSPELYEEDQDEANSLTDAQSNTATPKRDDEQLYEEDLNM